MRLFDDHDQAAAFLKLVREQAAGDRGYREAVVSECDLPVNQSAESIAGRGAHRWTHGAGGGRRTPLAQPAD